MSAHEILEEAAATYKQRSQQYGEAYKLFGKFIGAAFPDGLDTKSFSDADWARFGVFVQILSKTMRYAQNFERGGHQDSAHDLCVYAAMLEELTNGH